MAPSQAFTTKRRQLRGIMTRIDLAGGLGLAENRLHSLAPGLEHRSEFFPHPRINSWAISVAKSPSMQPALEAVLFEPSGQKNEMILQTLERSDALFEQKIGRVPSR